MNKPRQETLLFRGFSLALLLVLLITQLSSLQANAARSTVTGFVLGESTGEPIINAEISVLYRRHKRFWRNYWSNGWERHSSTKTDNQGGYTLNLEIDGNYLILVTHLNSKDEHDFVPYGIFFNPATEQINLNILLWKASIIHFKGLAYFIETTVIPETTFRVLEPDSNKGTPYGSLNLFYGSVSGSLSSHLGLPSDKIYVPSERSFRVEVHSYISDKSENVDRTLTIDDYNETKMEAGHIVEIDLRSLVLPQTIFKLQNETDSIEKLITEKETEGFFLAVERQQLSSIKQTTIDAISLKEQSNYVEAFTKSREAFVLISDLEAGFNNMLVDAFRSVYILIGFIGLTSIIIALLLFEDNQKKAAVSVGFFTILILILFYLHPGTQMVTRTDFVKVSVLSLLSVNTLALVLPRFLNSSSTGTEVSFLNIMVPILSISKRSLRRRRQRFALTLTSILLLVASFISLTSFTSGYGLSFTKSSGSMVKEGLMIRTPDPPPERAAAPFSGGTGVAGPLPIDASLLQWYNQMEEVTEVFPRYENYPQRQYRESYTPIAQIGRTPIFGVVGIEPELETEINYLDSLVVKGRNLGDGTGEGLISNSLAAKLDATIGDTLTLSVQEKIHELSIVGILDDKALNNLTDIDGKPFLPNKIIELERVEMDGPDFVIEGLAPCSPDEVIWVSLETGKNITALWLLGINMQLQKEVDILKFARSTALNRGLRAWASTSTGVYLAELTSYFEGKGLPIVIPLVIVVLNVMVTMMNAYYERRQEVMIYSSIGMNPLHISGIFLAEAAVIGVLGGCLGYLLGLGAYKVIYLLTPALQVKQKISAFWSLAAIGISMMAVLIGGLFALMNSTSITPSLRRRWIIDKNQKSKNETKIVIPLQIYEREIYEYIEFIKEKLKKAKKARTMEVRMLRMTQIGEKSWDFSFIYCSANPQISALYTRNRLVVEKREEKIYSTVLYTIGNSDSVKQVGSFIRQIVLDWSLHRE